MAEAGLLPRESLPPQLSYDLHLHLSCDMVYGMRITVAYDYLSDGW